MIPRAAAVRFVVAVSAFLVLVAAGGGGARSGEDTAPWPRSGTYVGADACRECHASEAEQIAHGVHAAVVASPHTMACETCHGPGGDHATGARDAAVRDGAIAKITHPQKLPIDVQAKLCGRCHTAEAEAHGGGGVAGLLEAGLGCTDCHSVHERRPATPLPEVRFRSRAATLAGAKPVPSTRCATCHPLQANALSTTGHRALATDDPHGGCTTCHGNGSLHEDHLGVARLISRPDHATDGVATCVRCHQDVHPQRAHWPDEDGPFLGKALDCFDCHRVHGPAPHGRSGAKPATAATTATGTASPSAATAMRNATCAECHAPAFHDHIAAGTVHAPLAGMSVPVAKGCGSCHAGAEAHARAGGTKNLVESLRGAKRETIENACLSCHRGSPAMAGLHGGAHARNDVTCTTCHSPSARRGDVGADAERNCKTCHADVAARFRLPNRHPVDEHHRMLCSDCHEPHSARRRLRDATLREDKCVECHRAYRGPFVYAHQASRHDGCVACHDPHGSSNRRMLHEATTQQNCLACHGDFPAFHDQTPGAVFTNCLNCHTQVHGSNHSRYLFR